MISYINSNIGKYFNKIILFIFLVFLLLLLLLLLLNIGWLIYLWTNLVLVYLY